MIVKRISQLPINPSIFITSEGRIYNAEKDFFYKRTKEDSNHPGQYNSYIDKSSVRLTDFYQAKIHFSLTNAVIEHFMLPENMIISEYSFLFKDGDTSNISIQNILVYGINMYSDFNSLDINEINFILDLQNNQKRNILTPLNVYNRYGKYILSFGRYKETSSFLEVTTSALRKAITCFINTGKLTLLNQNYFVLPFNYYPRFKDVNLDYYNFKHDYRLIDLKTKEEKRFFSKNEVSIFLDIKKERLQLNKEYDGSLLELTPDYSYRRWWKK